MTRMFMNPSCVSHSSRNLFRFRYNMFTEKETRLALSAGSSSNWSKNVQAMKAQLDTAVKETRRSANYGPSVWNYESLQSWNRHDVAVQTFEEKAAKFGGELRNMFVKLDVEPVRVLELVDDIQRLGLGSVYQKEIMEVLHRMVSSEQVKAKIEKNLVAAALYFRLLREHGFEVSQDVFKNFKDSKGDFKTEIQHDWKGMLCLYEASYLAFEEDDLLEEANKFTVTHLKNVPGLDTNISAEIHHALELPYHRRERKLEARWYMEAYGQRPYANRSLLEFAKQNFNMVQSVYYQRELKAVVRWWKEMGLAKKLPFARDRCTECYFWVLGLSSEPQFGSCREDLAKVAAFITIVDDVYDVYGTLDELQVFTEAVERWDVHAVIKLPDYMKLCFLALYNTINEIAYKIMKDQGVNCLPHLTNAWSDMCKAFLQEAKWSHNKITPTFHDYMQNGWVSVSGSLLLSHATFLLGHDSTKRSLDSVRNSPEIDLFRSPSMIFRICNDLATSADEVACGETANSIICHMRETGVSEAQSRSILSAEIDKSWKKMNKERVKGTTSSKAFAEAGMDLARISHCVYQHGDGHGRPDDISKNRVKQLILEPIPFVKD